MRFRSVRVVCFYLGSLEIYVKRIYNGSIRLRKTVLLNNNENVS